MTFINNPTNGVKSDGNSSTDNVGGSDTLNGEFTAGSGTMLVNDSTEFPISGTVKVDSEYVTYTGNTGTSLTGCTRGAFNTTDATHDDAAIVSGVFIGTSQLDGAPDVIVSLKSDVAGTEYFDFSNDNVNWDTFPIAGFSVSANIHEFHGAVKGPRYFRIRFESSASVASTDFRVNTYFGVFKQGNFPLSQDIGDDADSTVVRAVGVGKQPDGDYVNSVADGSAFTTSTPLAADAVFTSAEWYDTDGFNLFEVFIAADQPSAESGIMFNFTDDTGAGSPATRFSKSYTFSSIDVTRGYKLITIPTVLDGFQFVYTNGSTIQGSFYVEVTLKTNGAFEQSKLDSSLTDDADAGIVRAVAVGKEPDGTYTNVLKDGQAFITIAPLAGTTLAETLTDSQTGSIEVGDSSNFGSSGYIHISPASGDNNFGEIIAYSAKVDSTHITISARAQFGSTAASHSVSDIVGEVYVTDVLTLEGYTQVATKILSDKEARLVFQWYTDSSGSDLIREIGPKYPPNSSNVGIYDYLSAPSFGPYVRYIFCNNEATDQGDMYFETDFYTKSVSAQVLTVDTGILPEMTSNLTRSIVAGKRPDDNFENVGIDEQANLNVNINSSLTAFDEINVIPSFPLDQLKFIYGLPALDNYAPPGTRVVVDTVADVGVAGVQSIYVPDGGSYTSGDYFTIQNGDGTSYNMWFNVDSGGGSPGGNVIEAAISSSDDSSTVADTLNSAINTDATFSSIVDGNKVTITNEDTTGTCESIVIVQMSSVSDSYVSHTRGDNRAIITCGTGLDDCIYMRGKGQVTYRPGQGVVARYTSSFKTPESSFDQFSGLSNTCNGLFFGYNGTSFGIRHQYGGLHYVTTLQVTDSGISTGDITLRIDGLDFAIAITNGSVAEVANIIHATDFSTAMYYTEVVNDLVIFISHGTAVGTGTREFSFTDTDTTGVLAEFVEDSEQTPTQAVTDSTRDDILAADFTIDSLDGTGPSGMTIDPLQGNVFQIQYQWLGYGKIQFSVENPETGRLFPVHTIIPANIQALTSLSQPDMQLTSFICTTASGVSEAPVIRVPSMAAFLEGYLALGEPFNTIENAHENLNIAYDDVVLCAVRNPLVYRGIMSQVVLKLKQFNASSVKSANNTKSLTRIYIILGGTTSSALTFSYKDYDDLSTPTLEATPDQIDGITHNLDGKVVFETSVPSEGNVNDALVDFNININSGETLYVVYSNTDPSGSGNVDISSSLSWFELH